MLILTNLKLGPMLIQRHGMAKETNAIRRTLPKRQLPRDKPHARHAIPHTDEIHIDVDTERLFEFRAHFPAQGRVVFVEVVGEGYLGSVVGGEQTDFVQHSGQAAHGV